MGACGGHSRNLTLDERRAAFGLREQEIYLWEAQRLSNELGS